MCRVPLIILGGARHRLQARRGEPLSRLRHVPLLCPIPFAQNLYPMPCTLFPIPCTLFPISCTLYPVPYAPCPIPSTLCPVPCTLCFCPLHPKPETPYTRNPNTPIPQAIVCKLVEGNLLAASVMVAPYNPTTPATRTETPKHPTLYTLYHAPCTLPPTPYTLHPTSYTLHPTPKPCNLNSKPQTVSPEPPTLNPKPET